MKKYYSLLQIGAALFFFWAAWQTRLVLSRAGEREKTPSAEQLGKAPPLIALTTVALGGFRGLIVDILWMRLINLQKEGNAGEIAQLADWITKLEPQFTTVWAFHAWNMAYNISILYANPEHRWLWVKNGIQLLRDSALKYNPHDPVLCRELGWLYQHKIGQTMDDAHRYYKLKLAGEMEELFGGPRPAFTPDDSRTEKMRREYKLFPEIMQAVERAYGRLDWRLPETHALYWAFRGLKSAAAGKDAGDNDFIVHPPGAGKNTCACQHAAQAVNVEKDTSACDHMIFQSMTEEFRRGRLFCEPDAGIYITTPRLDLLPGTLKAYEEAIACQKTDLFKRAYINFLAEAVFIFHVYGNDREALKLFEKMLAEEPKLKTQMNFEKYILQCEGFKIAELPAADAAAWIEGLLYQSYLPARSQTNAAELRTRAARLWKQYADQNCNPRENLPPLESLDRQAKLYRAPRAERALDRKDEDK